MPSPPFSMSSPSRVAPFGSRSADSPRGLRTPSQAILFPCPPHSHGNTSDGSRRKDGPTGRTTKAIDAAPRKRGNTRQRGSNAQVRDDEGRSRGEAEKRVSGDPEKTPFPPVDSSTEQKPKGFPVPDGVDGVEGRRRKPSLADRNPRGFLSQTESTG